MKKGIHPTVYKTKVVCTSCGSEFETHSTVKEIRVDTCSNCHPFYTGKQRFAQAAGRIEKFNRKYGLNKDTQEAAPEVKADAKPEVKAEVAAKKPAAKKAPAKKKPAAKKTEAVAEVK